MKSSVYLVEKDFMLNESISKRFLIENFCELKGTSNEIGIAYPKIREIRPDILIFNYPMTYPVDEFITAMRTINIKMHLIALIDKEEEEAMKLKYLGVENILKKPFDIERLMELVRNLSIFNTGKHSGMASRNEEQLQINERNYFINTSVENNNGYGVQSYNQNSNSYGEDSCVDNKNVYYKEPFIRNYNEYSTETLMGDNNVYGMQNIIGGSSDYRSQNVVMGSNKGYAIDEERGSINSTFNMNDNQQSFRIMRQNLVAIHCPKGGVGKTSVSTNLATLFSTAKVGKYPLNVLLVDFDWEFGDVCVNMGMQPRPNVMNWINDIKVRKNMNNNADMNFTQSQIEQYLITYKTGLKILAAPASHNDILEIPDDAAKIIIDNIKNNCNFDVVIFDCGNNTNTHTLQALFSVHSIYEVITMDVSAMNDLSTLMSTLKSISFPINKIKLIVNKLPKTGREFAIEDISNALGLEVASIIPDNEKVRIHNNSGEPLVLSKTSNTFSEAIRQTANTIVGSTMFSKSGSVNTKAKGSFFSRIFKK